MTVVHQRVQQSVVHQRSGTVQLCHNSTAPRVRHLVFLLLSGPKSELPEQQATVAASAWLDGWGRPSVILPLAHSLAAHGVRHNDFEHAVV